jgi:uncharacterized OB-fold protein
MKYQPSIELNAERNLEMTTAELYDRPLPDIDWPLAREYWQGTKEHKILVQKCTNCGRFRWLPKPMCPDCNTFDAEWTDVGTTGTIFSFFISYRGFGRVWEQHAPYVVVLVEFDEAPNVRIFADLIDVEADPDKVKIGLPVEVVFDDITDKITLPRFRLRGSTGS